MDATQLAVALLGAGGGGAVLVAVINGLVKLFSGTAGRQRVRSTSLESQRVDAVKDRDSANDRADRESARADHEATMRRAEQEHSARLTRQLIENGITPFELPVERTADIRPKKE